MPGDFLSLVSDIGLAPGNAYEVGCASGEMLNQFRQQGWTVRGCDPSPSAISQAKAIFAIDVDLGGEEDALPAPGKSRPDPGLPCAGAPLRSAGHAGALSRRAGAGRPSGAGSALRHRAGRIAARLVHVRASALLPARHPGAPAAGKRLRDGGNAHRHDGRTLSGGRHRRAQVGQPRARQFSAFEPADGARMAHAYAARDEALWAATAQRVERLRGAGLPVWRGHPHRPIAGPHRPGAASVIAIADRDSEEMGSDAGGQFR